MNGAVAAFKEALLSQENNVAKVRSLYEAFGRGDIPAVLQGLHPKVVWVNPGPAEFRYFGVHEGREAIARNIFSFIGENLDIHELSPRELLASETTVVVLLDMDATVRGTGKRVVQKVAHVWTFVEGWPTRFHDFQDVHAVANALRG